MMITKTINKLFILFVTTILLFTSCVNNNDQPDLPPPPTPVELSPASLEGTWEVFFYQKTIIPTATNIPSRYRYTEEDGFTVTFYKDGRFHENNVFGYEIGTGDGKFLIGDYTADYEAGDSTTIWKNGPLPGKKKDGIFMKYTQVYTDENDGKEKTTLRMTRSQIPVMFETHFTYNYLYNGKTTNDNQQYKIQDIRYYRNMQKAPDFMINEPAFQKNKVDRQELLGTWEFYEYRKRVDHVLYDAPDSIKANYGLRMEFSLQGNKQVFKEFLPSGKENRKGEFKIIDDVVNIRTTHMDKGEEVVKSMKLWLKEPIGVNNGQKLIRSYDRYRDARNSLLEVEEYDFFKKVK